MLLEVLQAIPIEELCLANNSLSNSWSDGMKAIAMLLEKNTSLRHLDLGHNSLSERDILILAEALIINGSLQILNLAGQNISARSMHELSRALAVNKTLELLNLAACYDNTNRCKHLFMDDIFKALGSNTHLITLDLSECPIYVHKLELLAKGLPNNKTLQQLKINKIIQNTQTGKVEIGKIPVWQTINKILAANSKLAFDSSPTASEIVDTEKFNTTFAFVQDFSNSNTRIISEQAENPLFKIISQQLHKFRNFIQPNQGDSLVDISLDYSRPFLEQVLADLEIKDEQKIIASLTEQYNSKASVVYDPQAKSSETYTPILFLTC